MTKLNPLTLLTFSLVPALLLTGCFAQTESSPTNQSEAGAPAAECPTIACGWEHNPDTNTDACREPFEFGQSTSFGLQDDGASSCWYYDTVCIARVSGAPKECIPDACRREFVTCQPTQPMGQP